MKYATKIKTLTGLLTLVSLLIGYWYGTLTTHLASDDFNDAPYHTSSRHDSALVEANETINLLQQQLSQLSKQNNSKSYTAKKTRTAGLISEPTTHSQIGSVASINHDNQVMPAPNQWTQTTTDAIAQALNQQGISDIRISELQCDTSMCTVRFTHQSSAQHFRLIQHLNMIKEFSKGFIVKSDDNDNQLKTVIYFPRPNDL